MSRPTLSVAVLERFLSPEQLVELQKGYDSNKKGRGARSRFDLLVAPVTQEEKDAVKMYLDKTKTSEDVQAFLKSTSKQQALDKVNVICRKLVAQNQEKVL